MANLILPRRFTQQPQYPVEVDWSHPLTRGLKFGWTGSSSIDLVRRLTPELTAPIGATNKGIAVIGDGTNYVLFPNTPVVVTTSYSVYSLIRLTTTSEFYIVANEAPFTNQWRVSGYQSGGTLRINAPGGGDYSTGARTVNRDVFSVGVSCDSGVTNGIKYYREGRAKNVLTGTPPVLSGSKPISIMRKNYTAASGPAGMDALLVLMWDRPLSDDEQFALEQNPWQIFKKRPQVLYFDVGGGGPTQTLTPALFSNTSTFYSPTVSPGAVTLTPSLFTNSQTFYSATVSLGSVTLTPTLFSNDQTFYSPTVSTGSVTLAPSLFTNSQSFYSPTVTPGSVTLTPTLFSNDQTFYSAVVTQDGGTQYLIPSLVSNSNAFYAPSVTTGAVTITPDLFANTNSFYTATVSAGSVTLTPDLFTNTNTIYSATVTQSFSSQELLPEVVTNVNQFFTAIVTAGPVTLTPGLFVNESTFYVATVSVGSTITDAELLAIADAVWSHPDAIAAHAKLDDILACCND